MMTIYILIWQPKTLLFYRYSFTESDNFFPRANTLFACTECWERSGGGCRLVESCWNIFMGWAFYETCWMKRDFWTVKIISAQLGFCVRKHLCIFTMQPVKAMNGWHGLEVHNTGQFYCHYMSSWQRSATGLHQHYGSRKKYFNGWQIRTVLGNHSELWLFPLT